MFDQIMAYSVRNKLVIGLFVLGLIAWGVYSLQRIPIDAVPDITNNQVQVITSSPTLATAEVERFITTPVELALQNLQDVEEIRSVSFFGLSVVTVVFAEATDIYLARQLVSEHLRQAEENIPPGLGTPEMAPISTGLGEIYQYVVRPEPGFEEQYSSSDLRSIQDWIVRRQLSGIEGVVEVNTMGGKLKQYEVAIDPQQLKAIGITVGEVLEALRASNSNTGGAYIEKNPSVYYIRTDGLLEDLEDIRRIVVDVRDGRPILVGDVGTVQFGSAPRYGALIRNGEEAVGGRVMMLKGANSAAVTERVKERVAQIQTSLPEGVVIEPYLVRDKLVSTAIGTVQTNLLEGGLIVVFILILLLGNWRAGLVVASVIPLAMLFAISMMNVLGISANLMSLGAIDFGLIVDGAVIIVEAIVHRLGVGFAGRRLTQHEMDTEVTAASVQIRSSAAFGEIIILMVYLPILALVGIEGKMFRPMAQTVMLAILGALILSLTYVPAMSALFLSKTVSDKRTIADRIIGAVQRVYTPVLDVALRFKAAFVLTTVALFAVSLWTFTRMGGEFIPTLEEGDLAMQQVLPPGTSLSQSIELSGKIQDKLMADIPEILEIVTNVGSAEIPTDPMPVEIGDATILMKPKDEWTTATTRDGMFEAIEASASVFPGVGLELSQPIQLRFNELMTGAKADIAVKLYGEDLEVLLNRARAAEREIKRLPGVGTVNVEQTAAVPQIVIDFDYGKMAQYGLQVEDVNAVVRAGFAGATAGTIYEGDRRYDLVVRMQEGFRQNLSDVADLYVPLPGGASVPLREVAAVEFVDAPMRISRDHINRRIVIGVNVGDTDVETLVGNIQTALQQNVELPSGYYFTYGGQFENLQAASARLAIAVPVALALIFISLYFTFGSFMQALLIFVAIPLSAIGGVWALELRGMPFSISAGIGFIALFGVAVLNGIVLVSYLNQLKTEGWADIRARILEGTSVRLRPVIMTASVASLGFLPMALSSSGGAEVQRPLATVVIGGLITATFLTLVVLPILYSWLEHWRQGREGTGGASGSGTGGSSGPGGAGGHGVAGGHAGAGGTAFAKTLAVVAVLAGGHVLAQAPITNGQTLTGAPPRVGAAPTPLTLDEALALALERNPDVRASGQEAAQNEFLRKLPYAPGPTDFSYNGDALYRANEQRQNQLTVIQSFPSLASVRTANAVQDVIAAGSLIDSRLTVAGLRLEVRQRYYRLQQREASLRLHETLVVTYAEYYRIAVTRAGVGETNRLEALNLESQLGRQRLLAEQARLDIATLQRQLQALLQADAPVTAADTLTQAAAPGSLLDTTLSTSLAVSRAEQDVARARANISLSAAALKPTFRAGYSAQLYEVGGLLNGAELGVAIPLFRGPIQRRIEAQRLGATVAETRLEAERLRQQTQQLDARNALRNAQVALDYYREQLRVINPEIVRISRLNYRAGQLTYLELLNALALLADNNVAYLERLLDYNIALARFQYLSNE